MSNSQEPKTGPLAGIRVIEMAGIGPVPLAGLILGELGAEVVRIDRLKAPASFLPLPPEADLDRMGRSIVRVDLKAEKGTAFMLDLCRGGDILLEGFRPGVMERLGLGPDACHAVNPGLVYGRMTGFGQDGPLAQRAGHDLTYLALSGVLSTIGPAGGKPVPPLNLVADYGGGTMFLIAGVLSALIERSHSGCGQVVDAAMVDGASKLASLFFSMRFAGLWQDGRGTNLLDSGAPFYDTYETSDGGFVAVACLEPQFFAEFAALLPLPEALAKAQYDRKLWPEMRSVIAERLKQKNRDEWAELFADTDACVAPVLGLGEAPEHPHNRARNTHVGEDGFVRPAAAPRFSRTPGAPAAASAATSERSHVATVLSGFGIRHASTRDLLDSGIIVI
ncbi:MAG: CaiB/BaiF CoA-transferase family protein [Rhizobiaceae bacterium]